MWCSLPQYKYESPLQAAQQPVSMMRVLKAAKVLKSFGVLYILNFCIQILALCRRVVWKAQESVSTQKESQQAREQQQWCARNGEQVVFCWTVQKQNTNKEPRESFKFNEILNKSVPISPPLTLHAFLNSGTNKSISNSWANELLARCIAGCVFFGTKTRTQQNGINHSILPTPASQHCSSAKSQDICQGQQLRHSVFLNSHCCSRRCCASLSEQGTNLHLLIGWLACRAAANKKIANHKTSALLQNLFGEFTGPDCKKCPTHTSKKSLWLGISCMKGYHLFLVGQTFVLHTTQTFRMISHIPNHDGPSFIGNTAPHIIYLHVTLIYQRSEDDFFTICPL